MPSNNWLSIDSSFPTFSGDEPVKEQISALQNYMYKLTEQLKYILRNLGADNWNAKALQDFAGTVAEGATKDLATVLAQMNQLKQTIDSLASRVAGAENLSGRVMAVEEEITVLQKQEEGTREDIIQLQTDAGFMQQEVEDLNTSIYGTGGLEERMTAAEAELPLLREDVDENTADIEALCGVVKTAEDGDTVGNAGRKLHLVGEIYINGVLFGQEAGNETT